MAAHGRARNSNLGETATAAGQQARELNGLREQYRAHLRDKPNTLALVDYLFANQYMTIGRAVTLLGKSHPTAKAAISLLEQRRRLKEFTGRRWGRFYVCSPILEALERPIE